MAMAPPMIRIELWHSFRWPLSITTETDRREKSGQYTGTVEKSKQEENNEWRTMSIMKHKQPRKYQRDIRPFVVPCAVGTVSLRNMPLSPYYFYAEISYSQI